MQADARAAADPAQWITSATELITNTPGSWPLDINDLLDLLKLALRGIEHMEAELEVWCASHAWMYGQSIIMITCSTVC